jgi:hypothetical protein
MLQLPAGFVEVVKKHNPHILELELSRCASERWRWEHQRGGLGHAWCIEQDADGLPAAGNRVACSSSAPASACCHNPARATVAHQPALPDSNNLTSLPDDLSEFKHLRTLHLKYNQFRRLPPVIAQLPQLAVLELAANQIAKLDPAVISALTSLEVRGRGCAGMQPPWVL